MMALTPSLTACFILFMLGGAVCGATTSNDVAAIDAAHDDDAVADECVNLLQHGLHSAAQRVAQPKVEVAPSQEAMPWWDEALKARGSALLQAESRNMVKSSLVEAAEMRFVPHPEPASFEEMANVNIESMVATTLLSGDVIFTYPSSEDRVISAVLQRDGGWETDYTAQICEHFREIGGRGTFLDVGANIGVYTIAVARCIQEQNGTGEVIAVEGMPSISEHLMATVARNQLQNVAVYRYAVSDPNMTASTLTMTLGATNIGGSSVVGTRRRRRPGAQEVTEVTTLDSILAHNTSAQGVFFMKLDIEGFEGHALQGASHLLNTAPPCALLMETNGVWLENAGTSLEEVLAMLEHAGYNIPHVPNRITTDFYYQKDMAACKARFMP